MNEVFNTTIGKNDNYKVFIKKSTKVKIKIPKRSMQVKFNSISQIKKSMKRIKIMKKLIKMVLSQ